MKNLLPIALLILASTSSYGAFNSDGNSNGSGYSGGYKTDIRNGGYNTDDSRDNYYADDIDDANSGAEAAPKVNNTSKPASSAPAAAITKVKEDNPVAVVPKSNPDAGKKIQKVTKGGVVTYSWASSDQLAQNEPDSEVEIIKVDNSGFSNGVTLLPTASTCRVENIGVNTANLVYYGSAMPFKDLAKMTAPWDADSPLDVDANGYIKSLGADKARTIITDDNWGRDANDKRYVVLYDGEGKLDFHLIKPKVIKSEPGRIEIELQYGRAGMLQTSTNPANYLRNIRIVPIENEQDYDKTITRKEYRDAWNGVGVMRYLNSQRTNNSTEVEWSDRQKGTTFGAKKGQSLEDIIQMSNEMNTSPWLLVPHLANDDYFRQMAIYVRDNLNPSLKVHIEYSNETWNFGFQQAQYLYQLSQKNGTSRQTEYGLRSKKLFDVWGEVFGGNDRLVRVIGTQLFYPWISEQIMKTPGLADSVDALAVGYYIGHEFSDDELIQKVVNMTDEEVFDHLHNVSLPAAEKVLTEQKAIAEQHNVKLIAYEAGQHLLVGHKWREDTQIVNRFVELNRSPKMYQLYLDMYKQWNDVGGELIVWFQTTYKPGKWGNWGLLENISQDPSSAPKFRAFKKILSDNGC
ncbi:MAG: hypothetical protein COA63_012645 [Methylophaga sp.]|nr:hypothetical protein [Methylophaga sp.]